MQSGEHDSWQPPPSPKWAFQPFSVSLTDGKPLTVPAATTAVQPMGADETDVRQATRVAGKPPMGKGKSWKRKIVAAAPRRLLRSSSIVRAVEIEDSNRMYDARLSLRRANLAAAVLALAGLVLATIEHEIFYYMQSQSDATEIIKVVIDALTAGAIVAVLFSYKEEVAIRKLRNRALPHDNIWTLGLVPYLTCEIAILLLQPYPFINKITARMGTTKCNSVPLTDLCGTFMWMRTYLLARVYQDYFWKHQMNYFYSALNGVELDLTFTLKAALQAHPFGLVGFFFLVSFFAGSHVMWILERNCPSSQVTNFGDALWLMFVSMSTVGYGDIVPVSQYTRIVITFTILAGLTVTALYQTVMINYLQLTSLERRFNELVGRSRWRNQLRHEAAAAIQKVWRTRRDARLKLSRASRFFRIFQRRESDAGGGGGGPPPAAVAFPTPGEPLPPTPSTPQGPRHQPQAGLTRADLAARAHAETAATKRQRQIALKLRAVRKRGERRTQLEPDVQSIIMSIRDDIQLLTASLRAHDRHVAEERFLRAAEHKLAEDRSHHDAPAHHDASRPHHHHHVANRLATAPAEVLAPVPDVRVPSAPHRILFSQSSSARPSVVAPAAPSVAPAAAPFAGLARLATPQHTAQHQHVPPKTPLERHRTPEHRRTPEAPPRASPPARPFSDTESHGHSAPLERSPSRRQLKGSGHGHGHHGHHRPRAGDFFEELIELQTGGEPAAAAAAAAVAAAEAPGDRIAIIDDRSVEQRLGMLEEQGARIERMLAMLVGATVVLGSNENEGGTRPASGPQTPPQMMGI